MNNSSSISGLAPVRQNAWVHTIRNLAREYATAANLVGLAGVLLALFLFVAPLPNQWNIRLPFYLVLFVWIVLRPRVALYLMPVAVPWGSLDTFSIAGLNVNGSDILVAFLIIAWLMSFALRPALAYGRSGALIEDAGPRDREVTTAPPYLILALVILLVAMSLSLTVALSKSDSIKEISKWVEFLVLIVLGTQYLRTRRQIWILIAIICLAGVSQAFYGYFQAFFDLGPASFIRDTSLRVYGTFGQPNPFAGYLNIPLSIALALLLLGSNWRTRILGGLIALLLGGAEYLTQSRGGEIAIGAALIFIVYCGLPHLRRVIGLGVLAGLGILELFFTGFIPDYVLTPVLKYLGLVQISFTTPSAQDYSTAERLAHWIAGFRMFITHPLFGVGIGNYPDAYPNYYITIFVNSLGHAHNYYINIAAETGAVGLTALLLFLMATFVAGGQAYKTINKRYIECVEVEQNEQGRDASGRDQSRPYAIKLPRPRATKPAGLRDKVFYLLHPVKMVEYYRPQGSRGVIETMKNNRALAIGLIAALITVCVHNLVDDLYVHSVTNLIALLLIALIRLGGVTSSQVGGHGGNFDYRQIVKR